MKKSKPDYWGNILYESSMGLYYEEYEAKQESWREESYFPLYDEETVNKLNEKIDKLTTQLVSYEATIGYLVDALKEIRDDDSPPWDRSNYFKKIARDTLKGINK